MRTPEDEADSLVAKMKETGPQRKPEMHLPPSITAKDLGYGSLLLRFKKPTTFIHLTADELKRLVEYINSLDKEAL